MTNQQPTPEPTSEPLPEKINIQLPPGYVLVKEDDLRALEAKLNQRQPRRKDAEKKAKARRKMEKASRRINRR